MKDMATNTTTAYEPRKSLHLPRMVSCAAGGPTCCWCPCSWTTWTTTSPDLRPANTESRRLVGRGFTAGPALVPGRTRQEPGPGSICQECGFVCENRSLAADQTSFTQRGLEFTAKNLLLSRCRRLFLRNGVYNTSAIKNTAAVTTRRGIACLRSRRKRRIQSS